MPLGNPPYELPALVFPQKAMKLFDPNLLQGEAVNRPDAKRNRLLKLKRCRKL
jgi:hypothetical protein